MRSTGLIAILILAMGAAAVEAPAGTTISDNNITMTGELILGPDLAWPEMRVTITTDAGAGMSLDGCQVVVGNGHSKFSNNASGSLIPYIGNIVTVWYGGCTCGDWCTCESVWAPTYAILKDARGKPMAITYFKKGVNLEVTKQAEQDDPSDGVTKLGNSEQACYPGVVYE